MRNILWNICGSLLTGILVLAATPIYLAKLGLEGYGIVSLWAIMQFLMGLLDLGFGATLVREFAHGDRGKYGPSYRGDLLRTLEVLMWGVSLFASASLATGANWIAHSWLQSSGLPKSYVISAIQGMALAIGLQFPFALYSNGLCGLQEQGRMNMIQIVGSSLRYGIGIGVICFRANLVWFFFAQATVALTQTLFTRWTLWRLIYPRPLSKSPRFRIAILRKISSFSFGMAANTFVGVLLGNFDRLVLSGRLPTLELGRYSAAYTAASMLQMGIQPFYRAYFPRYSEMISQYDYQGLRKEYLRSCGLMGATIMPISIVAMVFAPEILWVWLGRQDPVMLSAFRWLILGLTSAGIAWLPAALQQAHGWTNLHVGMMIIALVIGGPAAIWCVKVFGPAGAAALWVVHGLLEISVGLWLMHRRLMKGLLLAWYRSVIIGPALIGLPIAGISKYLLPDGLGRLSALVWLVLTGTFVLAGCLVVFLWKLRTPAEEKQEFIGGFL